MPVDPGQPRGQVRRVPVDAAWRPQLTSQTLFYVGDWLEVAEQDLPEKGNVSYGQPQGVNLAQPLLVRKCWNMSSQLFKG